MDTDTSNYLPKASLGQHEWAALMPDVKGMVPATWAS